MRIGLVIEHFDPRRGGAEQWTCGLAEWLLAQGHEVHVVCQDDSRSRLPGAGKGDRHRLCAAPFGPSWQTEPVPLSGPVVHPLGRTGSRLGFAKATERQLRGLALDVVHDMGAGWSGDLIQSHDGSRLAQWEQKLLLLPPWLRPLKRRLIGWLPRYREFLRADGAAVFRSPAAGNRRLDARGGRFSALSRRPPVQIRVAYHGVDTERFSPERCAPHRASTRRALGFSEEETVLLLAAHNFAPEGAGDDDPRLGRLRGSGSPLRAAVVGGGRPGHFIRLARRCGVGPAVRFSGPVDDPLPYYAAADVYVQPTFYDSFGLTVLEAAACGLPVVTTQFAGVSELLSDGTEGYVLPDPADDAALAERLRKLSDPAVRRVMGSAARRLAEQHTFSGNCQQIAGLYAEIAGQRRV